MRGKTKLEEEMNIEKIREIADGNTGTDVGTLWALLDECADEIEFLRSLTIPIHSESEIKAQAPKVVNPENLRDGIIEWSLKFTHPIDAGDCPVCKTEVISAFKYCPKCVAKLNWSEEMNIPEMHAEIKRLHERIAELEDALRKIGGHPTIESPQRITDIINKALTGDKQ
jgi:hypothetical protein